MWHTILYKKLCCNGVSWWIIQKKSVDFKSCLTCITHHPTIIEFLCVLNVLAVFTYNTIDWEQYLTAPNERDLLVEGVLSTPPIPCDCWWRGNRNVVVPLGLMPQRKRLCVSIQMWKVRWTLTVKWVWRHRVVCVHWWFSLHNHPSQWFVWVTHLSW
jgi:hypothetical protein